MRIRIKIETLKSSRSKAFIYAKALALLLAAAFADGPDDEQVIRPVAAFFRRQ